MRNLIPPTAPFINWYNLIAEAKHLRMQKQLTNIGGLVSNRYARYESRFDANQLHRIRPSYKLAAKRGVLEHCYDVETEPLTQLKASILEDQLDWIAYTCQYCTVGAVETFDHYIPKSSHPEFAVLALNLIPSCSVCNGKKNRFWAKGTARLFLNLYSDQLPNARYLFCRISMADGVPVARFSLRNASGVPGRLYTIIRRHFKRLNLVERYNSKASTEITETLASMKPLRRSIPAYRKSVV